MTATYLVMGLEQAETTKRKHIQGYVEFDTEVSFLTLKAMYPQTHWEVRRGTALEASDYCKKEGKWSETGTLSNPHQGARQDIYDARNLALQGAPMSEIVQVASSFQAIRMAEKIKEHTEIKRNWMPVVHWLWGPTGTGKSRIAWAEAGDGAWCSSGNLRWWQSYDGQKKIIFDDFRGDFCALHVLLNILDRYPYQVEYKGGSRQLLADEIWITSPYHPSDAYKVTEDKREQMNQLLRRIHDIRYVAKWKKNGANEVINMPVEPLENSGLCGFVLHITDDNYTCIVDKSSGDVVTRPKKVNDSLEIGPLAFNDSFDYDDDEIVIA